MAILTLPLSPRARTAAFVGPLPHGERGNDGDRFASESAHGACLETRLDEWAVLAEAKTGEESEESGRLTKAAADWRLQLISESIAVHFPHAVRVNMLNFRQRAALELRAFISTLAI